MLKSTNACGCCGGVRLIEADAGGFTLVDVLRFVKINNELALRSSEKTISYLYDLAPHMKREAFLLEDAFKCGAISVLIDSDPGLFDPDDQARARMRGLCLADDAIDLIIEAYANAGVTNNRLGNAIGTIDAAMQGARNRSATHPSQNDFCYRIVRVSKETGLGTNIMFEGSYDEAGNLLFADWGSFHLEYQGYDEEGHFKRVVYLPMAEAEDYQWHAIDQTSILRQGEYIFGHYYDHGGSVASYDYYDRFCLKQLITYEALKDSGLERSVVREYDRQGHMTYYSWPGVFEKTLRWCLDDNCFPETLEVDDVDLFENRLDRRTRARLKCDPLGNIARALFEFDYPNGNLETEEYRFEYIKVSNPSAYAKTCSRLSFFEPNLEMLDLP